MTLVSPVDLRKIEQHLASSLDRLLQADGSMPAHLHPLVHTLRGYVMRGGKRVRPQLCIWSYLNGARHSPSPGTPGGSSTSGRGEGDFERRASLEKPNHPHPNPLPDYRERGPDALLDLACAWEIFHAFLLVHDDLIDVADTRRQTPSLHRQLQSLDHDSPRFGQNLAIVAGDLLFSVAIRLLAEMNIAPGIQVRLIRLFSRIACTTGFGQAIDLFQSQIPLSGVREEVLLCEYDWKTAAYTFEGPLLSGAILAGADAPVQAALSRFSRAIGQAYQLQNDLLDLSQPAHEGCDLVQGKRTVSLMRARANMSDEARGLFDQRAEAIATANGHAVRLAESLRVDLYNSGAIEQTQCMIGTLLDQARNAASAECVPDSFARSLVGLVDSLRQHYFASQPPMPTGK